MFEENLDELIELTNGGTIRKYRSKTKKLYKWYLCGLLKDILLHGRYYELRYYHEILTIKYIGEGYSDLNEHILNQKINFTKIDLEESFIINNNPDDLIKFFREILKEMKAKKKTLFMVKDFNGIFDVQKYFFYNHGIWVKKHHWIDINFYSNVIHTIPEFINYLDLIVLWNEFVQKSKDYKEELQKITEI
jgi:hypothetical protein